MESGNNSDELDIIISICRVCNAEVNISEIESHLALHKRNSNRKLNNRSKSEANLCAVEENVVPVSASLVNSTLDDNKGEIGTTVKTKIIGTIKKCNGLFKNRMTNSHDTSSISASDTSTLSVSMKKINENCDTIVDVPNGITKKGNVLFCSPCNVQIGIYQHDALRHSQTTHHKKRLAAFHKGINRIEKTRYMCTLCNCPITGLNGVEEHLETVLLAISSQSNTYSMSTDTKSIDEINKKFQSELNLPDGFTKRENGFICQYCNAGFNAYQIAIDHSKSVNHERRMVLFSTGVIRVNRRLYKCTSCNCTLKNLTEAEEHLKIVDYKGRLQINLACMTSNITSETGIHKGCKNFEEPTVINKIGRSGEASTHTSLSLSPGSSSKSSSVCQSDQLPSINISHINFQSIESCIPKKNLPDGIETVPGESLFLCTICNCRISDLPSTEKHVRSFFHKSQGKNSIFKLEERKFACFLCFNGVHDTQLLEEHLNSEIHRRKRIALCSKLQQNEALDPGSIVTQLLKPVQVRENNKYNCSTCNVPIPGVPMMALVHTLGRKHRSILQKQSSLQESVHLVSISSATSLSSIPLPLASSQQVDNIPNKKVAPGDEKYGLASKCIDNCNFHQYLPNGIEPIPEESLFLCTICSCRIKGSNNVQQHLENCHRTGEKQFIFQIRRMMFACFICFSVILESHSLEDHLNSKIHRERWEGMKSQLNRDSGLDAMSIVNKLLKPIKENEKNKYWCSICNVQIEGDVVMALVHTLGKKHQSSQSSVQVVSTSIPPHSNPPSLKPTQRDDNIIEESINSEKARPITVKKYGLAGQYMLNDCNLIEHMPDGIEWVLGQKQLFCTICNCNIPKTQSIDDHLATIDHIVNGPKVVHYIKASRVFNCGVCVCGNMNPTEIRKHLRDVKHWLNKSMKFPADPEIERKRLYDLPEGLIRVDYDSRFFCKMCSIMVTRTLKHAISHVEGKEHQDILKIASKNIEKSSQIFNDSSQLSTNGMSIVATRPISIFPVKTSLSRFPGSPRRENVPRIRPTD